MSIRLRMIPTAVLAFALFASAPAKGDVVLMGTDYFETVQPTFFNPLGAANPLAGLPIGPGTTDTIVRRLSDCSISLGTNGSACTIPIEMVALSLVSTVDPLIMVRESPTEASMGSMTIRSDGSGTGGTFDSFFDIFFELSFDGGATWAPQTGQLFTPDPTPWTTIEPASPPALLVDGLIGDGTANRHTNKDTDCPVAPAMSCVDFYVFLVREEHPDGSPHTARQARIDVPEPHGFALVALALALAGATRHRAGGAHRPRRRDRFASLRGRES